MKRYQFTKELRAIMDAYNVDCMKIYTNSLKDNRYRIKLYAVEHTNAYSRPSDWYETFCSAVTVWANDRGVTLMKSDFCYSCAMHNDVRNIHLRFADGFHPKKNKKCIAMDIQDNTEPVKSVKPIPVEIDWQEKAAKLEALLDERKGLYFKEIEELKKVNEKANEKADIFARGASHARRQARLLAFEAKAFLELIDKNQDNIANILLNKTDLQNAIKSVLR